MPETLLCKRFLSFLLQGSIAGAGVDKQFDPKRKPLYYPALFTQPNFEPMFDPEFQQSDNEAFFASLIVDRQEVVV